MCLCSLSNIQWRTDNILNGFEFKMKHTKHILEHKKFDFVVLKRGTRTFLMENGSQMDLSEDKGECCVHAMLIESSHGRLKTLKPLSEAFFFQKCLVFEIGSFRDLQKSGTRKSCDSETMNSTVLRPCGSFWLAWREQHSSSFSDKSNWESFSIRNVPDPFRITTHFSKYSNLHVSTWHLRNCR